MASACGLVILLGVASYAVRFYGYRQKRPYDLAAAFLDEHFQQGDLLIVNPPYSSGCIGYYLKSAYTYLPDGDPGNLQQFVAAQGKRAWFASLSPLPSHFESETMTGLQHGPSRQFELEDVPGLILRISSYQLPVR